MKGISIVLLGIIIGCNQTSNFRPARATGKRPAESVSKPAPFEIPATDQVVVIEEAQENSDSHELVVEIDQVNNRFTITGYAGKLCGISFNVIDRLKYEVLSADQARITHNGRVYELTRIDKSGEEGIFGDWTTEISEGEYQGNLIFRIRLNPVMKLESDCESIP